MSSANNSVTGGSYPNTPQKPDDVADESLDDLKATIREAQASTHVVSCLPKDKLLDTHIPGSMSFCCHRATQHTVLEFRLLYCLVFKLLCTCGWATPHACVVCVVANLCRAPVPASANR